MFARPRDSYNRKAGNGGGAQYVDRTFTEYMKPLVSKSSIDLNNQVLEAMEKKAKRVATMDQLHGRDAYNQPSTKDPRLSHQGRTAAANGGGGTRLNRTGDSTSYQYAVNDKVYIDRNAARRGYRVLSYKEDLQGRKVVFDLMEGTIYYCGKSSKRLTKNVVVFDSKYSALSERFPANQVGASKHGNGLYPRVLVSFDYWGRCMRRLGGGASMLMENVKFTGIVKFLDPPHPVPRRMVDKPVEPYFFTGPDYHQPGREIADRITKAERSFFPRDLKY